MEALVAVDGVLYRLLNDAAGSPALDWLMLSLSSQLPWVILATILVIYTAAKRSRTLLRLCIVLAVTIGLSDFVAYQVLKPLVSRSRPCYALKDVHLVATRCGSDNGFPSNHAANAMVAAVILSGCVARRRREQALFYGAAVLVGMSRVYLGVHYPLDVIGGFAVGGLLGAMARRFYRSPDKAKTIPGLRDTTPSTLE